MIIKNYCNVSIDVMAACTAEDKQRNCKFSPAGDKCHFQNRMIMLGPDDKYPHCSNHKARDHAINPHSNPTTSVQPDTRPPPEKKAEPEPKEEKSDYYDQLSKAIKKISGTTKPATSHNFGI